MAIKRPSFLKKLKEQQRRNKAEQKREARRAKKLAKAERPNDALPEDDVALDGDEVEGAESENVEP